MTAGKFWVAALGICAALPLVSQAADGLKCPVSGKVIKTPGDITMMVLGRKVDLCCPGCDDKVKADTAKYMPAIKQQLFAKGELRQMTCPLTGKPVNADFSVMHEGMKIGFCCKNCKAKFEKNAGAKKKALEALPGTLAWFDTCPGSGKDISVDFEPVLFEVAKGVKENIYFCCPGCSAPFKKDPAAGVAKLIKKQEASSKKQI